jgi:outer membrane receptor protein involved in Fe transport
MTRGLFAALASMATMNAQTPTAQSSSSAPGASPNQTSDQPIELATFVVNTDKDRGYTSTHTAALRLNTELKHLPLPVSVLNTEYINDLNRDNMRDLLFYTAAYNPDQGGSMRGLSADAGESATRNNSGFRGYQDAASIERMEILKGPAGLIYGLSQPGGRVNVFGIKASFTDANQVSLQAGSYDSYRAMLDVNRSFRRTFAARTRVMYRHEGFFMDEAHAVTRSYNFNALWRPFRRTEIELDWHHVNRDEQGLSRSVNGYALVNVDRNTARSARVPFAVLYGAPLSFNSNSEEIPSIQDLTIPTLTWRQSWLDGLDTLVQLNHQWRWQQNLAGDTAVTHNATAPFLTSDWEDRGGDAVRTWDLQLQLAYRFQTGPVTNKLSAYAVESETYTDFIRYYDAQVTPAGQLVRNAAGQTLRRSRQTPIPVNNFGAFQPIRIPSDLRLEFFDSHRFGNTKGRVANLLYQGDIKTPIGEFNALAGVNYVNSQANGPTPGVTGYTTRQTGVTVTTLEANSDATWSGGLVYSPRPNVQIYAANTRAVPSITVSRNSFGDILPLESSENKELGLRFQLLNDNVLVTAAYFDTTVGNRVVTDPSLININSRDVNGRLALDPGFDRTRLAANSSLGDRVAAGEYSSEGFEVEVNINLNRNTVLKLEYLDVDAAVSSDPNPARIGLRDNGFTPRTFTAVGKYTFSNGALKGLSLGAAGRLSGDRFIREDMAAPVGVVDLWRPGARRLDFFGHYRLRLREKYSLSAQLNIDNVNKDSRYIGVRAVTLAPYEFRDPRTWRLTLALDF